MRVVNVTPRTDEWHAWRNAGVPASEVAVILGLSPYKTPWRLWAERIGLLQPEDLSSNPHVLRGQLAEEFIVRFLEDRDDDMIVPTCAEADEFEILRASFDGLDRNGEPVEIKAPAESTFEDLKDQGVNAEAFALYVVQLQAQMLVANAAKGRLIFAKVAAINSPEGVKFVVEDTVEFTVERDDAFLATAIPKLLEFHAMVQERREPQKDPARDVYTPSDIADQEHWAARAEEYRKLAERKQALKAEVQLIDSQEEKIEGELIQRMGPFAEGEYGGLKITNFVRQGPVDWEALARDHIGDLSASTVESYRKPSSEMVKATVKKAVATARAESVSVAAQAATAGCEGLVSAPTAPVPMSDAPPSEEDSATLEQPGPATVSSPLGTNVPSSHCGTAALPQNPGRPHSSSEMCRPPLGVSVMFPQLKAGDFALADAFNIQVAANMKVRGYEPCNHPLVPKLNKGYVIRREILRSVVAFAKRNDGDALLLSGPTGSGKSSVIEQIAARINVPVMRVPCTGRTEFQDLLGQWMMINGQFEWLDGPLTAAARYGWWLILDECDLPDPSEMAGLNGVLDGMPLVLVQKGGEVIHPHPMFRIYCTGNTFGAGDQSGFYQGTRIQNGALMDRVRPIYVGYPDAEVEEDILENAIGELDATVRTNMVKLAGEIRRLFLGQGNGPAGEELSITMSTRGLLRWGRMIINFRKAPNAYEHALDMALTNRLRDGREEQRATIIRLAKDIFGESWENGSATK